VAVPGFDFTGGGVVDLVKGWGYKINESVEGLSKSFSACSGHISIKLMLTNNR